MPGFGGPAGVANADAMANAGTNLVPGHQPPQIAQNQNNQFDLWQGRGPPAGLTPEAAQHAAAAARAIAEGNPAAAAAAAAAAAGGRPVRVVQFHVDLKVRA